VLLQQLPYGGGEKLVRIRVDAPGAGISDGRFAPLELEDLRTQSRTLESVVEYHSMWFVLLGGTEPERVQTGVVSANFFDVLGVKPTPGRTSTAPRRSWSFRTTTSCVRSAATRRSWTACSA